MYLLFYQQMFPGASPPGRGHGGAERGARLVLHERDLSNI